MPFTDVGLSTEPTPFHMIGSAPHPVRFVYDGGTSNLQTKWSPATCSAHQLYEQLCQLGLADTREAFQPNRLGTTGIHPEVGQLAIFTVSNP
jgi:hypothetical protein